MNHRMIVAINCHILRIVALFMLPALGISLFQGEQSSVFGFLAAMALMFLPSITQLIPKWRPKRRNLNAKDGFVIVAITWVLVSALGALPFVFSGYIPNFIDAFFETVSGFTTTGASILRDVEALPMGLLYWRSFTHWLGGMGVLVFLLAIVPMGRDAGYSLYLLRAESPGPQVSKLVPRTKRTAMILYGIYIALTFLQIVLLLLAGLPLFDAITTAFGTAGTGGFSIHNDSLISLSPAVQIIVTVFMALFGVNFNVYYLLLMRSFTKKTFNEEFRAYWLILLGSSLVVALNILHLYDNFWVALRHAAFQVSSVMTTTGFATANFDLWPELSKTLLVLLMLVGASAGSTGGGVKVVRVLILLKYARNSIQKILHPRTVHVVHMDGGVIDRDTIRGVNVFIICYLFISVVSVLLISIDDFSFETTVTAMVACLNNIGPGLGQAGPIENFADFSWFSKLVLSADMLLGRLEIFPLIMACTPSFWRKAT